jgi:hypothetical protein
MSTQLYPLAYKKLSLETHAANTQTATTTLVMTSIAFAGLSSLAATYVFLRFLLAYTHHENEPKALATSIPFISPLLGMAKKGKFYTDLR